jgi:tetratricopeptide (TPR) repeat protein
VARSSALVRRTLAIAFAFVAVSCLAASSVRAQTASDVQRALEVTDAVIERATTLANCGPGETRLPCAYLGQAVALQASARSSYASGFYRDALALTLRARDRAYSAIRLLQDATGGEFVRFSLERTDALIDRIAPVVRASGVDAALRLIDVAVDLQRRARAQAEAGRPRAALSATTQARERAWRALRLAEGTQVGGLERTRALLDRTAELLRDSAWLGGSGDPASTHYRRAVEMQDRAYDRLETGEPRRAADLTLRARDQLQKALQAAERAPDREAVERALARDAQALATLSTTLPAGDPRRDALDRAEDHHRRAQEHFQAGRYAQAMAELRAAEEIRLRLGRP